ncbi:hypothetical protein BAUCODRAFT_30244 [Baudoinia panamericana UAMH 10762]|uniref:Uncharacterized protein n=1 Tax=Baudoinia panamericana (strain UAMH 10762) TaxID=717646 RepID=M2NL05_BAUPA|nr:uncharacterized protein BAUCODRAFT_30244 [Baudoinia panamericana UAMH 10762]EMC99830.1 hypothetical protein BAUCODRAFT_30244 [Baudoinia panamericana UAMH 10762]
MCNAQFRASSHSGTTVTSSTKQKIATGRNKVKVKARTTQQLSKLPRTAALPSPAPNHRHGSALR